MPAKKASVERVLATIAPVTLDVIHVAICGEKPIISNAFPQKVMWEILAKHLQVPDGMLPLKAKNPIANFEACIHYLRDENGQLQFAMPGSSFKSALVGACRMTKLKMAEVKQFFQVIPHRIRIYGDEPVMCEHRVRNDGGGVDIRHRAMYCRWSAVLPIRYHTGSISKENIVKLVQLAGFGCGIGDWRIASPKSNNGQMGAWRLAADKVPDDRFGLEHSKWCAKHPFDWDEVEQYGIVKPDRVAYYAQCAAAAAQMTPAASNGKKGRGKKSPATAEAAMEIVHGVLPVDGITAPDGYSPQE